MVKKRWKNLSKNCPECKWKNKFKTRADGSKKCWHCGYTEDKEGNKVPYFNRLNLIKKLNELKKISEGTIKYLKKSKELFTFEHWYNNDK